MGQHHPREKSGDQELSPCPWWRIKLNWGVRQLIDYITGLGATKGTEGDMTSWGWERQGCSSKMSLKWRPEGSVGIHQAKRKMEVKASKEYMFKLPVVGGSVSMRD